MAIAATAPGALQPDVEQVASSAPATMQVWLISAVDYYGDSVDDIKVYGPPSLAITYNDNGEWTIPRPVNGAGDAQITVVFAKDGYLTVQFNFTVPQQVPVPLNGSALAVTVTPGPASYQFDYTFTGVTLTYTKDNVTEGAVPVTPWTITRDSVDRLYQWLCTGQDGTTKPFAYTVPAAPQTDPGAPPATAGTFGAASAGDYAALVALVAQLRVIAVKHGDMA